MTDSTTTLSTVQEVFPQDVEVTLTLKFRISELENKNYLLGVEFIADIFDEMDDNLIGDLLTVNNLTLEQVKDALNKAAGLVP